MNYNIGDEVYYQGNTAIVMGECFATGTIRIEYELHYELHETIGAWVYPHELIHASCAV